LFFMLTLWSTIGVFISENILNLFTFFEIMSLTSYALIIHDEDDYCHEAGDTYIVMAVSGGLILLMGLFLLYDYTKTLNITELQAAVKDIGNIKYLISALIITGFGVKAGMVPLHMWLPKAHPAAPAPASAILSGILLKTGVFGIMITTEIMSGDAAISVVILVLGFVNMLAGGFLAMFQRNIKRILAYSSMSQIGYILVGIGLIGILKDHKAIAIYGTLYHIINHAVFKVLLFMGAGTIYMVLHELSINKIGGFGRDKKALKAVFFIGLCAIIGMPGFNGFASKTLLHEALSEAHHMYGGDIFIAAEVAFTLSSSFTVAYLLKIFAAVFIEKSDNDFSRKKLIITRIAITPMAMLAAVIIYIGLQPQKIINVLNITLQSFNVHGLDNLHFYSVGTMKSSAFTILLGVLIYLGFVRRYLRKGDKEHWYYENVTLAWFSLEKNLFRPLGKVIFSFSLVVFRAIDQGIITVVTMLGNKLHQLGKIEIKRSKSLDNRSLKNSNTLNHSNLAPSMRDKAKQLGDKLNSVTYSIYIFGIVLVLCLFIMIK
jgi:hydrogenase-4 component B